MHDDDPKPQKTRDVITTMGWYKKTKQEVYGYRIYIY